MCSVRACVYIDASGQSSDTPAAPNAWMARSITVVASRAATDLDGGDLDPAPFAPTVSISHAAFIVSRRACSISMRDSAISAWIVPWSAIGWPNATRCCVRSHISRSAFSAMPMARMQWWIRPGPRRACAIANPPPSSPRRYSAGMRTSSKRVSQWPPPASWPNTGSERTTVTPGVSKGTSTML